MTRKAAAFVGPGLLILKNGDKKNLDAASAHPELCGYLRPQSRPIGPKEANGQMGNTAQTFGNALARP